ncbi:MAG: MBL fold metallo-hydrolase [Gammaproteobacteria bacterium (ex Lamellibrachia satsuma)]|nr:MAG: MBL fold metallo-hydrolase [Gammaproteobacteria bacterium (ex Lamellibrachia satsuma)]
MSGRQTVLIIVIALVVITTDLLRTHSTQADDSANPLLKPEVTNSLKSRLPQQQETVKQSEMNRISRAEVEHEYGTDPNRIWYPESAINTYDVPNIVIKESDEPDAPLHTYQLNDRTWFLFGNIAETDEYNRGWNGNAGFVVTNDAVVVIDSLGTPKLGKRLIATIQSITDKPIRYLIVTHNHPDHAYGAVAFKQLGGVTILAHEGAEQYLNSGCWESSVEFRRAFIAPDMEGFEIILPDIAIAGEIFSRRSIYNGGVTFNIYNVGTHHSFGDLVIHQVEDNIVWVSDLAFNGRTTFIGDGNSVQALESIDWLSKTFQDAWLMVPGHGSAQTTPFPMIEKTRSYIEGLRNIMAQAVEDGMDLQDAVEQAESEEWKKTRLYELNHRSNANFIYREMEQEMF